MDNLILDVNNFKNISFENIISLYKQGYKLDELNNNIKSLNIKKLATCGINTIVQGTTRTVYVNPSGGIPPYTNAQLLRDGVVVATVPGPFNTIPSGGIPITYSFPLLGSAVYKSQISDSCTLGAQTSSDSVGCTIEVTAPQSNTFGCVNGICQPGQGILPAGCNEQCTSTIPNDPCAGCNTDLNICILGQCIPKKTALYAGIGIVTILLIT